MTAPVIIDTNVVVAGLLTAQAESPVARILDGMLAAAYPYALSETLLAEYRAVLVRPKLRRLHGLDAAEIDTLLIDLALHGILLPPVAAPTAPDPGDQHLWELLACREDLLLVTGDKRLFNDPLMHGRLLGPRAFVDTW